MNWGRAGWGAPLLERTLEVMTDIRLNVSQWRVLAGMNAGSTLHSVDRSRWEMKGCDCPPLLGTC